MHKHTDKKADFDEFADEYTSLHSRSIAVSGEPPEFFAEYKVADTAELARRYGLKETLNILDFGSGIGNSIPFFLKYFLRPTLTCVDVSERSLEISKNKFRDMAHHKVFNSGNLPFDNESFDIVFTACVFHHIAEEGHMRLLKEFRRVVAKTGFIIIFEHNPMNPLTLRAVNKCPFDEKAVLLEAPTLARKTKKMSIHGG